MVQKRIKKSATQHVTHAVRQAVVPHRHNDYRPHLIRFPSVIAIILSVFLFQMAYNFSQTGSVLGQTVDVTTRDLLAETNSVRSENGEAPLLIDSRLTQAAALKAQDMFTDQYWSHISPSGQTPWAWFEEAGYGYDDAGENLAKDFHSSAGVVTAWMNSADHRANLLNVDYTDVGFAVKTGMLNGETATVVVALYGNPKSSPSVAGVTTTAAAVSGNNGQAIVSRLGVGLQSMTPALVGSVFLLSIVALVAVIAHSYRNKLPYGWRRSWKRHHGAYTALSALSMVVMVVTLYGGGQI